MANFRTLNGGIIEDTWQDISNDFDATVLGSGGDVYYAYKKGHLVIFSLLVTSVTFGNNAAGIVQVIKTTSLNKPKNTTVVSLEPGSNTTPICSGMLGADGKLYIRSGDVAISNKDYYVSGCYYTNNL